MLAWAYIRKRYWETEMLAGQIVGMIGKALTADGGQEKPKEQTRARKQTKGAERFLKGKGFEIG